MPENSQNGFCDIPDRRSRHHHYTGAKLPRGYGTASYRNDCAKHSKRYYNTRCYKSILCDYGNMLRLICE